MSLCERSPSRRAVLGTAGAFFAWSFMPRVASAAGARDPRFVTIVLRGALDGLSAVAPVADPDYAALREGIALTAEGSGAGLPLDGFFVLHPAMPNFARLYRAGQATVVHAVATGYRDRSHFDGQDVLESGQPRPGLTASGWLNRVLLALPKGDRVVEAGALGIGPQAPLIVRGQAPVTGWAPATLPRAGDDLAARLLDLYRHRDPALAATLARGLETDRLASARMAATGMGSTSMMGKPASGPDNPAGMKAIAEGAARLLAADDGPRVAALAFEGWDTHANEGGATGTLATRLGGLDGALAALETGLGEHWRNTAVLVVTEFGRTARVNGTTGTDHGTATVAFLAGGAIRGGRVLTDWPGLREANMFEKRDLRPTTDLRAVAKGLVADLYGLSSATLGRDVFPGTADLQPVRGLVA